MWLQLHPSTASVDLSLKNCEIVFTVLAVCPPGYIFGDGCYEIGQKVVSIETDIKQAYYTSQEKCYARKGKLLVLDNLVNLMKITELVFNEYEKAEIGLWIGLTASEFRSKSIFIRKLAYPEKWKVLTMLALKY